MIDLDAPFPDLTAERRVSDIARLHAHVSSTPSRRRRWGRRGVVVGAAVAALVGGGVATAAVVLTPDPHRVSVGADGSVTITLPSYGPITTPPLHPIYLKGSRVILNEAGRAALAAAGTSRALGYLKATEWFHTDILGATTPSEMAAAEAKHVCPSSSGPDLNPDLDGWCRDSNGDTWATVYAADGTTVLGKALTGHVEER